MKPVDFCMNLLRMTDYNNERSTRKKKKHSVHFTIEKGKIPLGPDNIFQAFNFSYRTVKCYEASTAERQGTLSKPPQDHLVSFCRRQDGEFPFQSCISSRYNNLPISDLRCPISNQAGARWKGLADKIHEYQHTYNWKPSKTMVHITYLGNPKSRPLVGKEYHKRTKFLIEICSPDLSNATFQMLTQVNMVNYTLYYIFSYSSFNLSY